MLAIAELMKNGGKSPDSTSWNSSSVGTKRIVGGELGACGSVLKDSSHIQSTGKKKTNPTSHPTTAHRTLEVGNRRGAATLALCASACRFGLTEFIAWAPPGRWRRGCAALWSRRWWSG